MYNNLPIKSAVAAYKEGNLQACIEHYQKAIVNYPHLKENIQTTIEIISRRLNGEKVEKSSEVLSIKPVSNAKSAIASVLHNLGIECVYVVNLDRRPDRMARVFREVNNHGLKITKISAVDARVSNKAQSLLKNFQQRDVINRRSSAMHISQSVMESYKKSLTSGVFGYLLSQAAVFKDAQNKGYQRILVFDDDVFFTSDSITRLENATKHLAIDWKILLLGASEYANRNSEKFVSARISGESDLYFPIAGETCGSFAVAYDHSVYGDLLQAIDEAEGPYDNVALGSMYLKYYGKCFAIDPAVCVPDVSDSDIRDQARAQQEHSRRMRWEFKRYADFTAPLNITVIIDDFDALRYLENLKCNLPGNASLNIYYSSVSGIKKIDVGSRFDSSKAKALPIEITDEKKLRDVVSCLGVPRADIVMLWPFYRPIDDVSVQMIFSKALECANKDSIVDGFIDGVEYCLNAGITSPSVQGEDKKNNKKHKVVIGVTTYNRLDYLREFVETWNNTRNKYYEWTLIVSDDGSNDGTIDYLNSLKIEDVDIHIIKHQRVGVHESTNSIIDRCIFMDFDYGFKCDDDVIFKSIGWDDAYIDAMDEYPYLCNYNTSWRPAKAIRTSAKCVAYASAYYSQGALWTFTKAVIAKVGWFDVKTFGFKGYGHIDYSVRAARAGFNEMDGLFDLKDSSLYVTLQTQDYKPALSATSMKQDFGLVVDENLKERMRSLILQERRDIIYVPRASIYEYSQSTKQPRIHFIIHNNHIGGAEYIHFCHALALRVACSQIVIWSVGKGYYFDRFVSQGFTVKHVPCLLDESSADWKDFSRLVADGDFIYNANAYIDRQISELSKRKFIYHHAILHSDTKWIIDHHKKYRYFTHKFIAIHRHIRDALVAAGVSASKIQIVHNGLEPEFPFGKNLKESGRRRELLGIPANALVIGFVGRIAKDKNSLDLLRIADHVTQRRNDIYFVISGGAPNNKEGEKYGAEFLNSLSRMKNQKNIIYVGEMLGQELTDILNIFDVAINVSPSEGLPVSLLEQLAKGIYCVYPGFPAIADLLNKMYSMTVPIQQRKERTGLEYTDSEIQAFVNVLTALEKPLLNEQSQKIANHAATNFGFESFSRNLRSAFIGPHHEIKKAIA